MQLLICFKFFFFNSWNGCDVFVEEEKIFVVLGEYNLSDPDVFIHTVCINITHAKTANFSAFFVF